MTPSQERRLWAFLGDIRVTLRCATSTHDKDDRMIEVDRQWLERTVTRLAQWEQRLSAQRMERMARRVRQLS